MYEVKLVSIVKRLLTGERVDVWCVCSGNAVVKQCASRKEAEEIAAGNNLVLAALAHRGVLRRLTLDRPRPAPLSRGAPGRAAKPDTSEGDTMKKKLRLSATHTAILDALAAAGAEGLEFPATDVSAATLYRHGLVTRETVGRVGASRYYEGKSVPRRRTHTIRGRERTMTIYRYRLAPAEVAS